MRPMAVSEDDLAFGREFTNLSAKQADALRTKLQENKLKNLNDGTGLPWRMPRLPADRVRAYYQLVENRPAPAEMLANLVGAPSDPDSSTAAKELAKKFHIDLRQLSGTGPNGLITQNDVRDAVDEILKNAAEAEGWGEDDKGADDKE